MFRGTATRWRVDAVLAAWCGAAATVVYVLHGNEGELTRDLGLYTYAGQQVADGVPPYAGVMNRAGPLAHLLPGIGIWCGRLVGADDVLSARALMTVVAVAAVVATYLLGRVVLDSRPAGLLAAATLLTFEGFTQFATDGPREKTAMVLFATLALLAMARRRWLAAGVLTALATLTWQPAFFALIAGVAVTVLLAGRGRLRAIALVAVGGAIPTAITVLCYVLVGRLQLFLDCFLLINARYSDQSGMLEEDRLPDLTRGYGWSLDLFFGGMAAVLLLGVAAAVLLLRDRGRKPAPAAPEDGDITDVTDDVAEVADDVRLRRAAAVGVAVYAIGCIVWSLRAYDAWADTMVAMPAATVGVGSVAALLTRRLPIRFSVAGTAVATAALVTVAAVTSVTTRSHILDRQRAVVDAMLTADPSTRFVTLEAPQPLVLSHQKSATRVQLLGNGMTDYVDDTVPGGLTGFVDRLMSSGGTVFVYQNAPVPDYLAGPLREHYVPIGHAGNLRWYAARSLDTAETESLRQAVQDVAEEARTE